MDNQPTEQTNTLKLYGKPFQDKIIGVLVTDRAFLERIIDILLPEYFETDSSQWVVKFIMEYFPAYKNLPTLDVFKVELSKIDNTVLRAALVEQIKDSYTQINASDIAYIKDQFLTFCKNQKLKSAIFEASLHLKRGEYDNIWKVINDASKAGVERDFGFNFCKDVDRCLLDSARETIKTNWDVIDVHLDGGIGRGELGFVCASAGSGKSWILTRLGVEAMKQGKTVMHFTMELNAEYVGRRYASCVSGIPFQEVRKHPEAVKAAVKLIPGEIIIKYFPLKTASAATLKTHIEQFQLVNGVKIDMIIVDYADILRPFSINKNANSYTESGNVYEELRSILGELQIPGWSASQSNRSASTEDIIEADGVADSYRKVMTADFIMSLSRKTEDKLNNTGRIYVMKSRFGGDGVTYQCKFDASNGKIDLYDKDSVEGMEIIGKSKSPEEGIKTMLRKRWKDTRGESA